MTESSHRPSLKMKLLGFAFVELYLVILLVVAAFIIELSSSALGRSALDPQVFPYMAGLGALVISLDLMLFFIKHKSPISYIAIGPIAVVYAIFSQVTNWQKWLLFVNSEIDEVVHLMIRVSQLHFA